MDTMKLGHRCDLIFRTYQNNHEVPYEFGATEAGPKNEDVYGTKTMVEGYIKLPRILKDMLDDLISRVNHDHHSSQLRTIGFITAGLSNVLLQLDRPSRYVSRVTRSKQISISSDPSLFGTTVLPAIVSAWVCREIVADILNIVSSPLTISDPSWLDSCLNVVPPQPVPQTSSSSSTNEKKRTKSRRG